MTHRVTVLMPVYNGQRYLREAIESILAQTFRDFEFLIINDGSTDRSREVICSYRDARIRLVDNGRNLGLTPSLNRGLEIAAGEFIARQDADDISAPERLAKQVAFLEAQPDTVLLGTGYTKIAAEGHALHEQSLPCDCTALRWALLFHCPFVHSAAMLRKSPVLREIGFYDETFRYAQDYDYWSRIARRLAVANLAEPLVKYRVSDFSMSTTYGPICDDEHFQIVSANMREVLGASEFDRAPISAAQHRAMRSLVFRVGTDFTTEEATAAFGQIRHLHRAFSRYYRLSGAAERAHRAQVRSRMCATLKEAGWRRVGEFFGPGLVKATRRVCGKPSLSNVRT
jgi:hypothetical protein